MVSTALNCSLLACSISLSKGRMNKCCWDHSKTKRCRFILVFVQGLKKPLEECGILPHNFAVPLFEFFDRSRVMQTIAPRISARKQKPFLSALRFFVFPFLACWFFVPPTTKKTTRCSMPLPVPRCGYRRSALEQCPTMEKTTDRTPESYGQANQVDDEMDAGKIRHKMQNRWTKTSRKSIHRSMS